MLEVNAKSTSVLSAQANNSTTASAEAGLFASMLAPTADTEQLPAMPLQGLMPEALELANEAAASEETGEQALAAVSELLQASLGEQPGGARAATETLVQADTTPQTAVDAQSRDLELQQTQPEQSAVDDSMNLASISTEIVANEPALDSEQALPAPISPAAQALGPAVATTTEKLSNPSRLSTVARPSDVADTEFPSNPNDQAELADQSFSEALDARSPDFAAPKANRTEQVLPSGVAGLPAMSAPEPAAQAPLLQGMPAVSPASPAELAQAIRPDQPLQAQQFADNVLAHIRQRGDDKFEVRLALHPAELGDLSLQLEQDGSRLELKISVDNEQARRVIAEQLSQLRERMGEMGMQLGQANVEVRQEHQRQDSDGSSAGATQAHDDTVKESTPKAQLISRNGLDLYA